MTKRKVVPILEELNRELLGQPISLAALARMLHTSEQMVDALKSRKLIDNKMTTVPDSGAWEVNIRCRLMPAAS